jgi:hypothetical protein
MLFIHLIKILPFNPCTRGSILSKHPTTVKLLKHFQNRDDNKAAWQAEEEGIRRRAGMKASFTGRWESEPRNMGIFLAGENYWPDVSACLDVSLSRFWKCLLKLWIS